MNELFDKFRNSRAMQGVSFVVIILALGVLAVIGTSAAAMLLLAVIVILGIYLGSIRELVGSIVLVMVLKYKLGLIKTITLLFAPADKMNTFFGIVERTDGVDLVIVLFFFAYLLSFATGCVRFRLFTVSNNTEIEKKEEKEETPTEGKKKEKKE